MMDEEEKGKYSLSWESMSFEEKFFDQKEF